MNFNNAITTVVLVLFLLNYFFYLRLCKVSNFTNHLINKIGAKSLDMAFQRHGQGLKAMETMYTRYSETSFTKALLCFWRPVQHFYDEDYILSGNIYASDKTKAKTKDEAEWPSEIQD